MTPPPGPLSVCLTSWPLDFTNAVHQAAQLGFTHVDVVALVDRPAAHLEALAESGVIVQCAAVGRNLPAGYGLDACDAGIRRKTLDVVKQHIADAAQLGATSVYIVPGFDSGAAALASFAEACALLADYAAQRMMRFCVEHFPGRALPSVAATLAWLESAAQPNLFLLLDSGHCLLSGENPAESARRAGARLGYVHLDDNDGQSDCHWPLFTGQLTARHLEEVRDALWTLGYCGGLAFEFNPQHPHATAGLRASKAAIGPLLRGGERAPSPGR
jgi:sugar phosphate isomerase/epimerase